MSPIFDQEPSPQSPQLTNPTMGDKSPKSVNKQKEQKQKQAGAAQKKKADAAPKSGAPVKKK